MCPGGNEIGSITWLSQERVCHDKEDLEDLDTLANGENRKTTVRMEAREGKGKLYGKGEREIMKWNVIKQAEVKTGHRQWDLRKHEVLPWV